MLDHSFKCSHLFRLQMYGFRSLDELRYPTYLRKVVERACLNKENVLSPK